MKHLARSAWHKAKLSKCYLNIIMAYFQQLYSDIVDDDQRNSDDQV